MKSGKSARKKNVSEESPAQDFDLLILTIPTILEALLRFYTASNGPF